MNIVRIDPFGQSAKVEAIALAYQQAFGGEPWNEGYACPVCEKVFARTPSVEICPVCFVSVIEYWPVEKIVSDFHREMQKPDPVCVVAEVEECVIGFAWGYRISTCPDLDVHLDAPDVHRLLHGDFFYLDECALVPTYQGRGIGKLLVDCIFSEQRQKNILLRTMGDSRMFTIAKHRGGEIVQYISRGRVIMKLAAP